MMSLKKFSFIFNMFLLSFLLIGCATDSELADLFTRVDAGDDQTVIVGDPVTLASSVVITGTTYRRTQVWTEGNATLFTGQTFTKDDFSVGIHTITLTVKIYKTDPGLGEVLIASRTDDVVITVNAIDNAYPVAIDQTIQVRSFSMPINITLTGTDADVGDTLSFSITSQPTVGTLSGTPPNIVFTPPSGEWGSQTFKFIVNDQTVDSTEGTINLNVDFRTPIALSQELATDYNTPIEITLEGEGPDNAITSYTIDRLPFNGVLSGNPPDLTYTPNSGYSGSDSFSFYVSDAFIDSNPATIRITVNPNANNTGPIANAGNNISTQVGASKKLDGSKSTDPDNDPLTYSWRVISKPDGSVFLISDTTKKQPLFTADKAGTYTLTLNVNDGLIESVSDEVIIRVLPQLFSWCDSSNGHELWKRGGRSPALLTDIRVGQESSNPESFTFFKDKIFFSASNQNEGKELRSMGANGSISLVKDIKDGVSGSFPSKLYILNDLLFFTADDGVNGTELWVTDGDNPPKLLDINSSGSSYPLYFSTIDDKLYFKANDGTNGYELWESDGTVNGTKLVKNIAPNEHHSNIYSIVNTSNDLLFFRANDEVTNNFQLWRSSGEEANTAKIKDMGLNVTLDHLTTVGRRLYFTSNFTVDGNNPTGNELWKSDGSSSNTSRVADILPGANGSNPRELTSFNTHLYFIAQGEQNIDSLWRTDRNNPPIKLVNNISSPSRLTVVGDSLFYLSREENNAKLWRIVKDSNVAISVTSFNPIDDGSPAELKAVNNTLYVTTQYDDPGEGSGLWIIDQITGSTQEATFITQGCPLY